MGAAIAQYRSMPEEALRRECIRLASTTVVTSAVIVHVLPSGPAAADSGTAKPGTGAFVASPTNEAHGRRPDVLAITIALLAA